MNDFKIALYILKFKVAGNGAFGLLFQKLWAMLLLSFYPPSASISCSPIVLNSSSEIFPLFTHVIKNVHSDRSNLLAYEVEYDEAGETFDIPQSENDLGRETEDGEVRTYLVYLLFTLAIENLSSFPLLIIFRT